MADTRRSSSGCGGSTPPASYPPSSINSPEEIAHQGDLAGLLEADAQAGPIFRRLGGTANPLLRAWVRSATERAFAEGAVAPAPGTMPEEAERALESDRQWLALLAEWRMMQYRNTILPGSAVVGGGGTPIQADFTLLSRAARRLAPRIAFGGSTVALRGSRFHVEGSPTRAIHALLRDRLPQFVKNLDAMRRGITSSSWIEIQGCRVSQDPSYLRAAQAFFGGGKRPRVSAPDWYQFFGSYRVEILEDSPAALKRLWGRQQVQDAFAYWHRVFTGSPPAANADERTLRNFLRAPHALPLTSPYPSLRGIDLVLLKGSKSGRSSSGWGDIPRV
jgi:hypothetical protein